MSRFAYRINKEEYDQALKNGAESIINDSIRMGYGVYNAHVQEIDGDYWLLYDRGDSHR